ncbi:MAG: alanine--tRNA ligase [Parachlamydiales bacterium]|nr:alanine--tRNA ligase [Parachlamydiales bacterium]
MLSQQIRRAFLNYFKSKGHIIVPSSSVIPHHDPSLLFINAGMNQFKDVFLGESVRDYTRATTSQKCIRAGGKHNDLENVGHTSRHLTFFEMLGNFSFGDYFKKEAIQFAWEMSTQVFGFDPERIWPTVFLEDDEAEELWQQYVPLERIVRLGEKDNFWAMGDTGPCGPCSELLYDRGAEWGDAKSPKDDVDGERFLEFWNLVFMQYNKTPDGKLGPLPKKSIDTGSGLERVAALKIGAKSVFETDILRSLIDQVESISDVRYSINSNKAAAFHVIADHIRTLAFAISDGAQPSNIERGYVLRKILRRAVRYGKQLGFEAPFLSRLLPRLIDLMGDDYPEIKHAQNRVSEILSLEEEAFFRTLRRGGNLLAQVVANSSQKNKIITGDDAFKLKDTYGLPLDEILLIAKDSDLSVDLKKFESLEQEAKERSRNQQKNVQQMAGENVFAQYIQEKGETVFLGFQKNSVKARITGILCDGQWVNSVEAGQEAHILLNQTPFYAEKGGQVGDKGVITHESASFDVTDCQQPYPNVVVHVGKVTHGHIHLDDMVEASIDQPRRQKIANNHTATHLLHWALHKILGGHIKQAGSVVDDERLRFDFNHHKALSIEEIEKLENLVNEKIRANTPVEWYEIPYEQAQEMQEIKQFFGEKYGAQVRVVNIEYSKELCGGTHTDKTGNIGYFRIVKESSIAAGVRRIEAITGSDAEQFAKDAEKQLKLLCEPLKATSTNIQEKLLKLVDDNRLLSLEIKQLKKGKLSQIVQEELANIEMLKTIPLLVPKTTLSFSELKDFSDEIMNQMKSGILVVSATDDDKASLLVRVTPDLVTKGIKAGDLVKIAAPIIEGSGGGKPEMAQAGGKNPKQLKQALQSIREWIEKNF